MCVYVCMCVCVCVCVRACKRNIYINAFMGSFDREPVVREGEIMNTDDSGTTCLSAVEKDTTYQSDIY